MFNCVLQFFIRCVKKDYYEKYRIFRNCLWLDVLSPDWWTSGSILTHEILVIVVISIVDNPVAVPLIESAQSTGVIMLGVDGAAALEARLPETLIKALAETASSDLRMELTAQTRIPITLEGRVWTSTVGEQVRCRAAVRVFRAARYGRIYVS